MPYMWWLKKLKEKWRLDETLREKLKEVGYDVTRLEDGRKMVLITGHRRENFGDGFINICKAIKT